jgi:phage tail-like protein
MADDQGHTAEAANPRVSVTIGNQQDVAFESISAMNVEAQVIEYRHGNNPSFYPIKMPGLGRVGNVVLRKAVLTDSSGFKEWHAAYESGLIKPFAVVISVLAENEQATLVWTLHNAWPARIGSVALVSTGQDAVEVELLEIACESITVSAGQA